MNDLTGRIIFSLLTNELSGTLVFCAQIICWENQVLMSILEMLCDPVVHVCRKLRSNIIYISVD